MRVPLVCRSGCLALAALFFVLCPPPVFAGPQSDEDAAARILGSEWKHLSRRAGIIFAGSVLSVGSQSANCEGPAASSIMGTARRPTPLRVESRDGACPVSTTATVPAIELRFRVDHAIAAVESGQVVTIREWTGALSRQRALRPGDRVLILLYPPSRLGLTSPVGGSLGQVRLDPSGQLIAERGFGQAGDDSPNEARASKTPERDSSQDTRPSTRPISVSQIARAIRAARGE